MTVLAVDLIDKRLTSLEQLLKYGLCRTGVPLVLLGSKSDLNRIRDDRLCAVERVTVDREVVVDCPRRDTLSFAAP